MAARIIGAVAGRPIAVDPDTITIGDMIDLEEAQERGRMRDLAPVIARLLGMSLADFRGVTAAQFREIGAAIGAAAIGDIPNEIAPVSTAS